MNLCPPLRFCLFPGHNSTNPPVYSADTIVLFFEEVGNVPQRRVTNWVVTDHHFAALITTEWDYSQPPCFQRDQRAAAAWRVNHLILYRFPWQLWCSLPFPPAGRSGSGVGCPWTRCRFRAVIKMKLQGGGWGLWGSSVESQGTNSFPQGSSCGVVLKKNF